MNETQLQMESNTFEVSGLAKFTSSNVLGVYYQAVGT